MNGKYSPEKLLLKILELDAVEFLGICKIIGVDVYEGEEDVEETVEEIVEETAECGRAIEQPKLPEPRNFYDIWIDVVDVINQMNRTRRRNLGKLVYPATKKEK